ncbi:MAG: hypothetical protein ABSA40_09125 [Candidatus Dormibacteria bacterium]
MIEGASVAVDYQPSGAGPFLWQAFDAAAVAADLAAIARAGFGVVRVGLAWDSFMPDARGVDRRRIGELDVLLRTAARHGLRVIPVLFVQAHGDCVLLPARTVLRRHPRSGVRVLSEGLVEPGGPRDVWTDTLMLDLADRWLRHMISAFSGHPAILAWDLGDDPARVVRPRRIAHLAAWVKLMAGPLRAGGDRVQITLGAGDIRQARGVRLTAVAPHVDRLDIAAGPADLRGFGLSGASAPGFLGELGQALAGEVGVPLGLAVAIPSPGEDAEGTGEAAAAVIVAELAERRAESGLAGLRARWWSDLLPRLAERAPFDRNGWLLRCGLVRADGSAKPALGAWAQAARAGGDVPPPRPWPDRLDVEGFYANLPESLLDLASEWHRVREDHPGILGPSGA